MGEEGGKREGGVKERWEGGEKGEREERMVGKREGRRKEESRKEETRGQRKDGKERCYYVHPYFYTERRTYHLSP